ncbi:MAG: lysophospholipase [Gordonia sp. (in: high G+C Gram-positive bacteria)]|uniref:alpha/beta hydrolase n=1 Tax=Gordonia sp. (in: high G+C Gram-positive bacteria) TaxID=84139 RepID=UPI003BB688DC
MADPIPFDFDDSTGRSLAAYHWPSGGAPRAAVLLVHGMGEHALRYQAFAEALADAGFAVYAYDQRGHGSSIHDDEDPGTIGAMGWTHLVDDIVEFAAVIREEHPDCRVGVVAHSMGSFATQQTLLRAPRAFDAIVFSGTAALDLLEPALDLSGPLDLSGFNTAFEPARTDFDWLSRDEEQVDRYIDDARCGFGIDLDATVAMFAGARLLADPAALTSVPPTLPVLVAVGDADPVNAALALVHPLIDRLRTAGLRDVTQIVYPGARHEILNETNRAEVVGDLVGWLTARLT